ncbi:sigma-70 family RNA polymerase sigma factor [Luteimonas sp. Y-2-2-4F]|nr:sigma-70 family RNA polymerase sigma factor [Luteimonas sp. Y-2-2-4F]MCD9033166.1 sigma-70 family RNA polymerase sigma factor [Luteimonas sp. Y-2-2-4F]
MDNPLDEWFAREILVHEPALMRYLLRWWPHRDEVPDLRQEVYVRVYEAAARALPQQPKSLLFTTARNFMTDRWRRNRVVPLEALGELPLPSVLVDEITPDRSLAAQRELRCLVRAFDRLPARRREVLWLRRVEELPIKEIAERMGITPKTAENHLALATQAIADMVLGGSDRPLRAARPESGHGQEDGHGEQRRD